MTSKYLAELISDALLDVKIISKKNFERTVELIEEEINIRIALGHLVLKGEKNE